MKITFDTLDRLSACWEAKQLFKATFGAGAAVEVTEGSLLRFMEKVTNEVDVLSGIEFLAWLHDTLIDFIPEKQDLGTMQMWRAVQYDESIPGGHTNKCCRCVEDVEECETWEQVANCTYHATLRDTLVIMLTTLGTYFDKNDGLESYLTTADDDDYENQCDCDECCAERGIERN